MASPLSSFTRFCQIALCAAPLLLSGDPPPSVLPLALNEEVEQGVVVSLQNPSYIDGVLSTTEGGVIQTENIRIQAQNISYTRRPDTSPPEYKIEAEGKLMVDFHGRLFVAKKIEYDVEKQVGRLLQAKTETEMWYLGSALIELRPDGSVFLQEGYVTTCSDLDSDWDITARDIEVQKSGKVTLNSLKINAFSVPIFWLPRLSSDAKQAFGPVSPFTYRFKVGGGHGALLGARYRFVSRRELQMYAYLEYRLRNGPGAGLDIDYRSQSKPETFLAKNYAAYDDDFDDNYRYRFMGAYLNENLYKGVSAEIVYDRLSDKRIVDDYRDTYYDPEHGSRSYATFQKEHPLWHATLSSRVRINPFQSVIQQLPQVTWYRRPISDEKTGIVFSNHLEAGFLDMRFADYVTAADDFHSGRLAIDSSAHRPFRWYDISIVPQARFVGLLYTNDLSPAERSYAWQPVGLFSCSASRSWTKVFSDWKHAVRPYLGYTYCLTSENDFNDHHVFSIDDAYVPLSQLRAGVHQTLLKKSDGMLKERASLDIYSDAFFATDTIERTVPRLYMDGTWLITPKISLSADTAWDFDAQNLHHLNALFGWTYSDDFAMALEYRHRSKYAWRKADESNFMLDAGRSKATLLASPVSDQRNNATARLFWRLHPKYLIIGSSRHGWHHPGDPSFTEYKVDLVSILRCTWELTLSYESTYSDDRLGIRIDLANKRSKSEDPFRQHRKNWMATH